MGWSKQDDIKWNQDKKKRKEKEDSEAIVSEITREDLYEILDDLPEDDLGPKAKKSNKEKKMDDDEPTTESWNDFFMQQTD